MGVVVVMPSETEMTKDMQPMVKKTTLKSRKKKKYTQTAVEKAAEKSKGY